MRYNRVFRLQALGAMASCRRGTTDHVATVGLITPLGGKRRISERSHNNIFYFRFCACGNVDVLPIVTPPSTVSISRASAVQNQRLLDGLDS